MRKNAILWTIVGIAVLVRLPALLNDGLWRDEAYAYVDVIAPSFAEFLHRVSETEWHPPLFFVLEYAWTRVAGSGEIALGLLPFAFGVATVPIVYLLGRAVDSRVAGLLGATIFALAPMAIAYSDEYVYAFAGFTFALLAWRTALVRTQPITAASGMALSAATLAAVYSHYTALFVVPLLAAWALAARNGLRQRAAIVAAFAAGSLPFALWLPVFLYQRHIGLPYEGVTSVGAKASYFIAALLEFVPARPATLELAAVVLLLAAIAVVARARRIDAGAAVLGTIFLATLLWTTALDLLAARYVVPCYPLLCVFFGSTLAQLAILVEVPPAFRPYVRAVAIATACVVAAGNVAFALSDSSMPKSGMRSLAKGAGLDSRTLYVIAPDYMAATFFYYARGVAVTFRGFVRDEHPEIFKLDDYVADWTRPGAVDDAVAAIAARAPEFRCIDVLVDSYARDQAAMPYGKAWELLHRLERRYRLTAHTLYPARYEPVDSYVFATARGSGAAQQNCR
ncbi:MAG: glycosyltransferase family 39 protein [Candidatus Eremiobacteraeota bacterium]|nr:glycosyltransferase family 39 protein [Candidatus Eremiobacteraeota bacterium]